MQQLVSRFVGTTFCTSEFRFCWDQTTFTSSLEYGSTVALEIGLHTLEGSDNCIKPGKLCFDFSNNTVLFGERCQRNSNPANSILSNIAHGLLITGC